MAINTYDGRFALFMWVDPNSDEFADHEEFSDQLDELRATVPAVLRAGKYKYVALSHWDAASDDWIDIEEFTEEDIKE